MPTPSHEPTENNRGRHPSPRARAFQIDTSTPAAKIRLVGVLLVVALMLFGAGVAIGGAVGDAVVPTGGF